MGWRAAGRVAAVASVGLVAPVAVAVAGIAGATGELSLLVGVCVGAEVLATAGLLEGRPATSHWLGLIGLRRNYPQVGWTDGVRSVDDGDLITSGGVLSGVDGAPRVAERRVGEVELASAFRPDSELSYLAARWVAKTLQYLTTNPTAVRTGLALDPHPAPGPDRGRGRRRGPEHPAPAPPPTRTRTRRPGSRAGTVHPPDEQRAMTMLTTLHGRRCAASVEGAS
jgi:putative intracellular protease/amidase